MRRALVAFVVCAFLSVPAFGQIFYEPVKYQYTAGDQAFYYGGSNPYLLDFAYRQARVEQLTYGRSGFGQRFAPHVPVWSDLLPYRDMTDVRWDGSDAANEANANVARYFRKADALAGAHYDVDGTIVVPAKGPSVYLRPMVYPVQPHPMLRPWGKTTRPSATNPAKKGEVIIIPKTLLDRPLKDFVKPGKQVALAN
jgi:hypothetical protein